MDSTNVDGKSIEVNIEHSEQATMIDPGAHWFSSTKEDDLARGLFDPRDERSPMPLLKVDTGAELSLDRNTTPSRALSSRNPFRRASPSNLSNDFTSDTTPSPLLSPLSAMQIEMEELEMEERALELSRRKLALRKKRLQLEESEGQERLKREAESQAQKRRERDLQQQMIDEAERKENEDLEIARQEQERVELERCTQLKLDTERNEREHAEQLKTWLEERECERLEAEKMEQERESARLKVEKLEQEREIQRFEVEREEQERESARLEIERKEQQRLEEESPDSSKREQETINAETKTIGAHNLGRENPMRKVVKRKQPMIRDGIVEERRMEESKLKSDFPISVSPSLDTRPQTDQMTACDDEIATPDEISSIPPIPAKDAAQKPEKQTDEHSDSFKLMEKQGNVAKHRRKSSNYSTQSGNEKLNTVRLEPSATDSARPDDHMGGSNELLSASSTPPDSLDVSRHTSVTSQNGSMASSRTDEELAWEIAVAGALDSSNINELHPLLQGQIRAAMDRHKPQDEIVVAPIPTSLPITTSRLLLESDIPSRRPPVPPKTAVLPPSPIEHNQSPHPATSTPPMQSTAPIPTSTPGRSTPFSRKRNTSSVQWGDFDSEAGAEPIDEDLCFCGKSKPSVEECYFCWPCNGTIFCNECWDTCPPHQMTTRRKRINHNGSGLPHEKTEPAVAKKIFDTLQSDRDHDEQALLHVQDEDTSWFGAGRDEDDDVVFQDFGRYASLMAEKSARDRRVRYPSLVSFVGQTGAGKSSLIRLLIELYAPDGVKTQVPVVGSNLHQDVPTSGDVHLYADPKTFEDEFPILHADCEGLDGGEREPMGAKARNKRDAKDKRTRSFVKHIRKQHHTSEREILWAKTDQTRSREYHVRNLYPRLLYTFSDVIVFVMKNPRVIENAIEQLIRWAEAALETSSNQPVLPHAIIVLNASDNASDPELWDVNNATVNLMESVRRAVHQNHSMRKFAETWRQRGRTVETVEMLLLSYYSTVRVVRVVSQPRIYVERC
jgi:energy-coupling factor transporter ATP-binding protein EcfA2